MEVGSATASCILWPVWMEGRRVERKNESWPGLGGQDSSDPSSKCCPTIPHLALSQEKHLSS